MNLGLYLVNTSNQNWIVQIVGPKLYDICSLKCDEDGWGLQVNEDEPYPHMMHRIPVDTLDTIQVKGSSLISFAGVVPSDLEPSSFFPVGFNLTYECPEGMVFETDWFANPVIRLTCQQSGEFDEVDFDSYLCVYRKFNFL